MSERKSKTKKDKARTKKFPKYSKNNDQKEKKDRNVYYEFDSLQYVKKNKANVLKLQNIQKNKI